MRNKNCRAENVTFDVSASVCGTTHVISLRGELDLSTAEELDAVLEQAFAKRAESLVIDLSESTFIDSTGIRSLLAAQRRAERCKTRLVIVPAPPEVQRVFKVCGLETVLPFVPDCWRGPNPGEAT
jgi:anti-sigma B factor antagonist